MKILVSSDGIGYERILVNLNNGTVVMYWSGKPVAAWLPEIEFIVLRGVEIEAFDGAMDWLNGRECNFFDQSEFNEIIEMI